MAEKQWLQAALSLIGLMAVLGGVGSAEGLAQDEDEDVDEDKDSTEETDDEDEGYMVDVVVVVALAHVSEYVSARECDI